MNAMNITIANSFLPHTDAEASTAFYRDVLGFEVRLDVGQGQMRWITVGPVGQDTAIVLHPPAVDPGLTDAQKRMLDEIIAKGTVFAVNLATDDVDAAFAAIEAAGTEIIQEPMDQDWGTRDCAFRDPAGNMIRLQQKK